MKTPHLDQLAADGTRFDACITPCVVCQPARASILTGQLPRTHGVHDNGIDLDPAIGERGFAGALSASGYDTAFFGKAHFSTYHTFEPTGTPECLRSSARYDDSWHGPYMGFDPCRADAGSATTGFRRKNHRPASITNAGFTPMAGATKRTLSTGKMPGDTKGAAQTWHSRLPVAWHNSTWTADRAIEWLKNADRDDPFCAWVSFPDPHHPFDCPEPWSWLHDPATVDLPRHRTRHFEGPTLVARGCADP